MTNPSTCTNCGEALGQDDLPCPKCGTPRSPTTPGSIPTRGATQVLGATSMGPAQPPENQGQAPAPAPGTSAPPDELTQAPQAYSPATPPPTDTPSPPAAPPPALPETVQAPPGAAPPPPSEPPAPPQEDLDGWHSVRLELEEATRGDFEIVKELGRGGMAAVYLAKDLALGRSVAIKVMAPGLLMGAGMVDRFKQEAVTIANLHHPNIVTIHTVGQAGNLHFFVMQVVDGGSLEDILERPEPIPVFLTQAILYQLGVGLAYAHRRGVIHRDIKPANVLLDQEGNSILTDFGIAKVTTASNLTQTGSTIGTPAYMSPEQAKAGKLTDASDQYSLGVVAYEMLTGSPPFSGSPFEIMQAHTATPPMSIVAQCPECPPELETAVLRMMAKEPEERFADVAEAIEALGGYLPGPQDPIRTELALLVTQDPGATPSARAPLKPTPGRGATPAPSKSTGKSKAASMLRGRMPLWITGAASLATMIAVGIATMIPSSEEEPAPPAAAAALPVSSISFANPTEDVLVGTTVRVRATVQDSTRRIMAGENLEWSSADPGIATVEGSGDEAILTGIGAGTTTIVARAGGMEGSLEAMVSVPAAGELTVSAPSRQLLLGAQLNLSAILTDDTGAQVDDPDVTWSSSNTGVVLVDSRTGVVMGQGLGRAQIRATSGEESGTVSLNVIGRVDAVEITPPNVPLQAGGIAVVRTAVTSLPAGYRGAGGVSWTSSNPAVASVSFSDADSVVLTLLGAGETILSAQADGVQGVATLRVEAQAAAVTLNLSQVAIGFEATEGGASPEAQTVTVSATGGVTATVGPVLYGGWGGGWLTPVLSGGTGQNETLTLRADVTGLAEGAYTANVPVEAGPETRAVAVTLTVAENPANAPVEPNAAASQEITALMAEYALAINAKNTARVREIFPSLPEDAINDLLGLRETDTYVLQLVPGSLRLGSEDRTLDGDVLSSVLGGGGRGEAVRMIYTFTRGEQGWFIISLRTGN